MADWSFLGTNLCTKDGEKPTSEVLAGKEFVLIYFSAHWCPPCRGFTPELVKWYNNGGNAKCEIVFCSWDQDESSFKEYYDSMPWAAVCWDGPRNDVAGSGGIPQVGGIPSLIVMNGENGAFMTDEARGDINPDNITFWDPEELAARAAAVDAKKEAIKKRGEVLMDKAWAKMDTDGSGKLEKAEVKKVLDGVFEMMAPPGADADEEKRQFLDQIFSEFDLDKDGALTKEEALDFFIKGPLDGIENAPSGMVDQVAGTIEHYIDNNL